MNNMKNRTNKNKRRTCGDDSRVDGDAARHGRERRTERPLKGIQAMMTFNQRLGLLLVVLSVTVGNSLCAQDGPYEPVLPKVLSLDGVVVLDWAHPKTGAIEKEDFRATLLSFQGLVNRTESTKVYFTSVPIRVFETGDERNALGKLAGPGDPCVLWLEEGLIPGERKKPVLDAASPHPVFDYLWENYRHLVKGKVLCPDRTSDLDRMGTRAAALTAATFENALMVPESVDTYLRSRNINLPVLADTRKMDSLQAFRWSIERYANHPKRNRRVVAFVGDINPPVMWDYWVATYTFSYWLHKSAPNASDPVDGEFDALLNPRYYPPGVPNIGPIEGAHVIQRIQKLGYTPVCGILPNASVTASIPTNPKSFGVAWEPAALTLDPNGVYLSFNGPDGDALDFLPYIGFKGMKQDPNVGTIPLGWRVNPYFIDLFPTLFAYFATRDPVHIDIVGSMNDGGASLTAEGKAAWQRDYLHYIRAAGGHLRVINFFGGMYSTKKPELIGLGAILLITGYQGEPEKFVPEWVLSDRTLFSNQIGLRGGPKVPLPGGKQSQDTLRYLRETIKLGRRDTPLFIMARLPSEAGAHAFSIVSWITDELRKDVPQGRKVFLVPPRDLAATWHAWQTRKP
jgi:hypothetical protein